MVPKGTLEMLISLRSNMGLAGNVFGVAETCRLCLGGIQSRAFSWHVPCSMPRMPRLQVEMQVGGARIFPEANAIATQ